ncbi:MAG: crossover junction endodeoxyribonuclease RuvC [Planctomycetes bacterium]|nr:crossover junction endodeoxyribonuclease RuvC [Planctomycetota bacterium]
MKEGERIVVGVDPGLNITGYGVLAANGGAPRLVEAGVIRGGRGAIERRLQELHVGLSELLATYRPAVVAIEELYSHYDRPRTAILMGHARGVICLAAAQASSPVFHYAATHVKKMLTGSGRAPKNQMQAAVCREFGLREPPHPADVADAVAIALCHHYSQSTTWKALQG